MPESSMQQPAGEASATTRLEILGAWLFVGIPLAWGVWEVAVKSLDLFTK